MDVVCQISGGWDSAAALALVAASRRKTVPIFIDYGQKYARKEREAVQYVLATLKKNPTLKLGALVEQSVRNLCVHNHGMLNTDFIPMRNLVLCAMCANWALANSIPLIAVGSKSIRQKHSNPWSFADSTQEFYDKVSDAASFACTGSGVSVRVIMPVLGYSKLDVLRVLMRFGLDPRKLWSCYDGGMVPCGQCFHCKENTEALTALRLL